MRNFAARLSLVPRPSAVRLQVARFGFSIRTRSGVLIENLSIPGASSEDAERKLRQIYMDCSVVARFVPEATAVGGGRPGVLESALARRSAQGRVGD